MYSSFYELKSEVGKKVVCGEYSDALDNLKRFIISVTNEQSLPVEVVGSRKIDELCELIGDGYFRHFFEARLAQSPFRPVEKRVVIVCTGLYKYGATSLVVGDLVKAHPGYECSVIATDYLNDMSSEDRELSDIDASGAVISVCPPGEAQEKLGWLIQQFLRIAPARIFLLNHHQDPVAIAAARPFVDKTKVIFYHHSDHNICVGVHMEGAVHVDPHNIGFYNCRNNEGIRGNVYVPLTVHDNDVTRVGSQFVRTGELTTCSSGAYHKFSNFYLYPYQDMLVDRFKGRNGRHIHIGEISPSELAALRDRLTANDIDAERFVHIPGTPSLWRTLVDQEVDLFIGSFPMSCTRTTIEVMGAGLPILMPENYLSRFASNRDLVYPDAFLWKYPAEFAEVIRTVTPKSLGMHAARSRAHYILQYSSDCVDVAGKIEAICNGLPTSAPYELYPYQPDHLDKALHFNHVAHLTASHAAQQALASVQHGGALDDDGGPPDNTALAGNRFIRTLARLREKTVGDQVRRSKKAERVRRAAVNRLPPEDRQLYRSISQRPDGAGFDPASYLRRYPDVAAAGVDPLLHFVEFGQYEGREPSFLDGRHG
ncbi:hypothetical protein [Sphingomonas sp. PAMC 26621]|uniref:hypothetical protein n=1 Tax=Sphingomonas sp. PAMC 26621 TaxID=1112213 RepID=UPI0002F0D32E|nr:hypothetical protein [Sphingomonas sp. PAMC 26621]